MEVQVLTNKLKECELKLAQSQEENNCLLENILNLQSETAMLKATLEETNCQLQKMQAVSSEHQYKFENLTGEIKKLREISQKNQKNEANVVKMDKNDENSQKLKDYENRIAFLSSEIYRLTEKTNQTQCFEKDIAEMLKIIEKLNKENQELVKNSIFTKSNSQPLKEFEDLSIEKSIPSDIYALQNKLRDLLQEIDNLKTENQGLTSVISRLKSEEKESFSDKKQFSEDLAKKSNMEEIKILRDENSCLKQQLTNLRSELNMLKEECQRFRCMINELEEKICSLVNENNKLKKKLSELEKK